MASHTENMAQGISLVLLRSGHLDHSVSLHLREQEVCCVRVSEALPVDPLLDMSDVPELQNGFLVLQDTSDQLQVGHAD